MRNRFLAGAFALISIAAQAQVTKVGNDTLIDVAGWNVEWFGDTQNGPSNEPTQYTNVKSVITNTDLDVWGLAEISNTTTFTTLLNDLGTYDGVESSFSQTQKTALIWKKSKFNLMSQGNVLTAQSYNNAFAGRPPLEVALKTKGAVIDTLYFYVVHLKANSGGSDQDSYDRRKEASGYLKTFLDQYRAGKKVFVIGDWNDDIDVSVVNVGGYLETPFKNFVDDTAHYFYPSKQLSAANEKSYVFGSQMIDHQMISKRLLDSFYVSGSAKVLTQLSNEVINYGNSTSDHYPVMARYNFKRYLKLPPVGIREIAHTINARIYPNPANTIITIESNVAINAVQILNNIGEAVLTAANTNQINIESLPAGMYILKLSGEEGTAVHKLLVNH
jgi:exonuclease III